VSGRVEVRRLTIFKAPDKYWNRQAYRRLSERLNRARASSESKGKQKGCYSQARRYSYIVK